MVPSQSVGDRREKGSDSKVRGPWKCGSFNFGQRSSQAASREIPQSEDSSRGMFTRWSEAGALVPGGVKYVPYRAFCGSTSFCPPHFVPILFVPNPFCPILFVHNPFRPHPFRPRPFFPRLFRPRSFSSPPHIIPLWKMSQVHEKSNVVCA